MVVVNGFVGKSTPHAFKRAGVRVEDNNSVIAVTVGDECFIGLWMDPDIRGAMNVFCVSISFALIARADLQNELTVGCEFQ